VVTSHTIATPSPDVVYTQLQNGESVLLHLGTKTYYSLNEAGSRVWQLINGELSVGEIAEHLEAEYDVTLDIAQQTVSELFDQLVAEKLVNLTGG